MEHAADKRLRGAGGSRRSVNEGALRSGAGTGATGGHRACALGGADLGGRYRRVGPYATAPRTARTRDAARKSRRARRPSLRSRRSARTTRLASWRPPRSEGDGRRGRQGAEPRGRERASRGDWQDGGARHPRDPQSALVRSASISNYWKKNLAEATAHVAKSEIPVERDHARGAAPRASLVEEYLRVARLPSPRMESEDLGVQGP